MLGQHVMVHIRLCVQELLRQDKVLRYTECTTSGYCIMVHKEYCIRTHCDGIREVLHQDTM